MYCWQPIKPKRSQIGFTNILVLLSQLILSYHFDLLVSDVSIYTDAVNKFVDPFYIHFISSIIQRSIWTKTAGRWQQIKLKRRQTSTTYVISVKQRSISTAGHKSGLQGSSDIANQTKGLLPISTEFVVCYSHRTVHMDYYQQSRPLFGTMD